MGLFTVTALGRITKIQFFDDSEKASILASCRIGRKKKDSETYAPSVLVSFSLSQKAITAFGLTEGSTIFFSSNLYDIKVTERGTIFQLDGYNFSFDVVNLSKGDRQSMDSPGGSKPPVLYPFDDDKPPVIEEDLF